MNCKEHRATLLVKWPQCSFGSIRVKGFSAHVNTPNPVCVIKETLIVDATTQKQLNVFFNRQKLKWSNSGDFITGIQTKFQLQQLHVEKRNILNTAQRNTQESAFKPRTAGVYDVWECMQQAQTSVQCI